MRAPEVAVAGGARPRSTSREAVMRPTVRLGARESLDLTHTVIKELSP
ncbi:MAG: hypothetical protein ACRDQZ_03235 [Mycobacteriales bacterium]